MNRLDESLNYAKACQDVIDLYGDDFRRGCASIELIKVPVQLHPMLHGIRDLAFDITEAFRDPEDDEYYWADIRQSVKNFMDYRVGLQGGTLRSVILDYRVDYRVEP